MKSYSNASHLQTAVIKYINVLVVTGEEVDFVELLESFGVNIPNLSSELGIDIESLTHMDRGVLLSMLTQHPN